MTQGCNTKPQAVLEHLTSGACCHAAEGPSGHQNQMAGMHAHELLSMSGGLHEVLH